MPSCTMLLAFFLLAFSCDFAQGQTTSPAKPASSSAYKVLRSISGIAGHEENGRYLMDDPRSVFVAGKDAKVTVYFEWEGPMGPHHFEGLWKSPEGKIVLISDFRYEAKAPRYNGYWSMLLSEATPSGEWNLEARIDGEPAGSHSFVISGSPSAASASGPRMLSSSELYQKAFESTVTIEKIATDGSVVSKSSGFWIGEGRLLTAFSTIDGASSLRVTLRDGSQLVTDQVLAWNRWQDWALLKLEGSSKSWLKPGAKDGSSVGDRCMFLEFVPAGAKLADGSVTGKNSFPKAGERLLIASGVTSLSFGGPLLDEYGNYVGILGGSIIPGGDPIRVLSLLSDPGTTSRTTDWDTTGLAVPQALLPEVPANAAAVRLADLAGRGELLSPVIKTNAVQSATMGTMGPGSGAALRDYKRVFSRRDVKPVVQITWQSVEKGKFTSILRLFNTDNKAISESKPRDISMASGKYMTTIWEIPAATLPAGIYRFDLVLNGKTAWRDFFRIAD
ncbi:MAG: trypsin-like serine protease with C-terminal domain [Candidatus Angelobacter sp.]|nr:trypsin-like serine protease with C-terminal domain [Candidatus Angelobacter sp.]